MATLADITTTPPPDLYTLAFLDWAEAIDDLRFARVNVERATQIYIAFGVAGGGSGTETDPYTESTAAGVLARITSALESTDDVCVNLERACWENDHGTLPLLATPEQTTWTLRPWSGRAAHANVTAYGNTSQKPLITGFGPMNTNLIDADGTNAAWVTDATHTNTQTISVTTKVYWVHRRDQIENVYTRVDDPNGETLADALAIVDATPGSFHYRSGELYVNPAAGDTLADLVFTTSGEGGFFPTRFDLALVQGVRMDALNCDGATPYNFIGGGSFDVSFPEIVFDGCDSFVSSNHNFGTVSALIVATYRNCQAGWGIYHTTGGTTLFITHSNDAAHEGARAGIESVYGDMPELSGEGPDNEPSGAIDFNHTSGGSTTALALSIRPRTRMHPSGNVNLQSDRCTSFNEAAAYDGTDRTDIRAYIIDEQFDFPDLADGPTKLSGAGAFCEDAARIGGNMLISRDLTQGQGLCFATAQNGVVANMIIDIDIRTIDGNATFATVFNSLNEQQITIDHCLIRLWLNSNQQLNFMRATAPAVSVDDVVIQNTVIVNQLGQGSIGIKLPDGNFPNNILAGGGTWVSALLPSDAPTPIATAPAEGRPATGDPRYNAGSGGIQYDRTRRSRATTNSIGPWEHLDPSEHVARGRSIGMGT